MKSADARLQLLHTTDAYQSAVIGLMVGEANFAAEAMGLTEKVFIGEAIYSEERYVHPPPWGIGGSVVSSSHDFSFLRGQLRSVTKRQRLPPQCDLLLLAQQPCKLDTRGAYELAKKWLTALSVDVDEVEKSTSANVFQAPARRRGPSGRPLEGIENNVPTPLFMISWGSRLSERLARIGRVIPQRGPIPSPSDPLFVEILGTTNELLGLYINEPSWLQRTPLQLPNAEELLGPVPSPDFFVEQLFGGPAAVKTVAAPEMLQAWLLTSIHDNPSNRGNYDRLGPVNVAPELAAAFSQALLSFDSYSWSLSKKGCILDFGARLQFRRGSNVVDIRFCFQCGTLELNSYGGHVKLNDFDPSHNAFVKALQAVFPSDAVVRSIPLRGSPH